MIEQITILETEFGVELSISDLDVADSFEDYLNEEVYAPHSVKLANHQTSFYFGKAASKEKVSELFNSYLHSKD